MDLNQLYFDHQILLMRASSACCEPNRVLHRDGASIIARRIAGIHRASGANALQNWVSAGASRLELRQFPANEPSHSCDPLAPKLAGQSHTLTL